jgi:hypothetical protein
MIVNGKISGEIYIFYIAKSGIFVIDLTRMMEVFQLKKVCMVTLSLNKKGVVQPQRGNKKKDF